MGSHRHHLECSHLQTADSEATPAQQPAESARRNHTGTVVAVNDPVAVSAIVTLSFSGTTLGELEAWCDALANYGIDEAQQLLDGGHVRLADRHDIGPITATRGGCVADVRAFVQRARSSGAPDDSVFGADADLLAVDLLDPVIETFPCASHIGFDPQCVMISPHPLCRDHI